MNKLLLILFLFPFHLKAQIITTYAGTHVPGYSGDSGVATNAQLNKPMNVAVDSKGNLFISDKFNNVIRKVDPQGIITTFAGDTSSILSGDGGPATMAGLPLPWGIAIDDTGNLYVAEPNSHVVRKIDTSGIITTYAGNGVGNFSGDSGLAVAAGMSSPLAVATDKKGNVYITDPQDSRIRKVDRNGIITTIAGNGTAGYNGDNIPAVTAELNDVEEIRVDAIGNIYFTEGVSNLIRKIDTSGLIIRVAGNPQSAAGYSGDGGLAIVAHLNLPLGLCPDTLGNLYFADAGNNVVRKINQAGIINTIVGSGMRGFLGDGDSAINAQLNNPTDVTIDRKGNLYIVDYGNNEVRMVNNVFSLASLIIEPLESFTIYPNPAQHDITVLSSIPQPVKLLFQIVDMNGKLVQNQEVQFENGRAELHTDLATGVYTAQLIDARNASIRAEKLVVAQ